MPRQPTVHAYRIPRLNVWFLVGNVLLLLTFIALVMTDFTREWKEVQRGFHVLEREHATQELEQERATRNAKALEQTRADLAAATADLTARDAEHQRDIAAYEALLGRDYGLQQQLKFAKAELAVYKYNYELARDDPSHRNVAEVEQHYEATVADIEGLTREYEEFTVEFEAAKAKMDAFTAARDAAAKQESLLLDKETRLLVKLQRLKDDDPVNKLRDAPLLDFMDPRVRIKQILLPNLVEDLNMTTTMRIDRCTTCHQGVDAVAYTDAPQPYTAHPRLAEFVASKSPHPMESFGCTTCHSGRPRGTTFLRAAHWPSDRATEARWTHDRHWHELHHWDYDMTPKQFLESSCYQCHKGQTEIAGAPKWNRGIRLMELTGCFGCHKVRGFEDVRKSGPALLRLAQKTTPEWTYNWIRDPRGYRPSTRMPQLFDLENVNDSHNRDLTTAGINAMVTYLFAISEQDALAPIPVGGKAARGETLLNTTGCLGCHQIGAPATLDLVDPRTLGPNLANLGSKLSPEWLYHWLKDPHAYFPDAWMPNLRLSDQDAADITAFLLTQRDAEFEARPRPPSPPAAREELALTYLRLSLTDKAAKAKLAKMSEREQAMYLGERLVRRNGCFGCHDITGFEKEQRIGTELTEEGSKDVLKFDFGLLPSHPDGGHEKHAYTQDYSDPESLTFIPRTRHDWIMTKLLRPRIWDRGKEKSYDELLKMPWFDFTPEDAEAITTAVLGFQRSLVSEEMRYDMSPERQAIARGRRLVRTFNCRACHVIEGRGRAIAATIAEEAMLPPVLTGQGKKAQTQWLFDFLIKPEEAIRPWLTARMPTFGFSGAEANTIVEYFARLDAEPFPSVYYDPESVTASSLSAGQNMFEMFRCQQCHVLGEIPKDVDTSSLAPNLLLARERLKPSWVTDWILDPQAFQPGTKMPTFWPEGDEEESPYENWLEADAREQADAIRDHIFIGLHGRRGGGAE